MRRLFLLPLLFLTGPLSGQDLCSGMVTDKKPYPRTPMAKPALGDWFRDPDIVSGARIMRMTDVASSRPADPRLPVIKPLYSPVAAWNADESYLLLLEINKGYRLYNGKTYEFIKYLTNHVTPADIEQMYWDPTNPKILYFPVAGPPQLIKYNVDTDSRTVQKDFTTTCGSDYMYSESHGRMATVRRLGFICGNKHFAYDIDTDSIFGPITQTFASHPYVSPLGTFIISSPKPDTLGVYDLSWNFLYYLDIGSNSHADFSVDALGREVFHFVAYDNGPAGAQVGMLTNEVLSATPALREKWVTIGGTHAQESVTGFPYPWSGIHLSGTAFKNPGWIWASVIGGCAPGEPACGLGWQNAYLGFPAPQLPKGQDYLDNEITISNVNTGVTCRVAHNRSAGKRNTHLVEPYFSEPHVTASPSGTRAVFASDWGVNGETNGDTVDTYVIELPAYLGTGAGKSQPPPKPVPLPGGAPRPAPAPPPVRGLSQASPSGQSGAPPTPSDTPSTNTPSSLAASDFTTSRELGFGEGGEYGYSFAGRTAPTSSGSAGSTQRGALPAFVTSRNSSASSRGQAKTGVAAEAVARGVAQLSAGRYESAEQELVRAAQENPRSAAVHYYLGYTYYLLSQNQPANKEYSRKASESIARAFRIDPAFAPKWGGKLP